MRSMIVTDKTRLHVVSTEIEFDAKTRMLAKRLASTATVNPRSALGLAAPQIGVTKRALWWRLSGYPGRGNLPGTGVACNPTVLEVSDETWDATEGCLSFAKSYAPLVRRPQSALIRWYDVDGNVSDTELTGMACRVWLHEIDHLDGVTFDMRAADPSMPTPATLIGEPVAP